MDSMPDSALIAKLLELRRSCATCVESGTKGKKLSIPVVMKVGNVDFFSQCFPLIAIATH